MTEMYDPQRLAPAGGRQSAPQSGTYGDQADLDRLEQSAQAALPPRTPSQQQGGGVDPGPALMPDIPPGDPLPPNLRPGSIAPTEDVDGPMLSPVTQQEPVAELPPEQRIQLLEALVRDPNVSETTRRIAMNLLEARQQ